MTTTPHPATAGFPPILKGYAGLSLLTGETLHALQCRAHREPESIPPAVRIGRLMFWVTADAIEWYRSRASSYKPARKAHGPHQGRPTKRETLEAQAAGMTVKAYRAGKVKATGGNV